MSRKMVLVTGGAGFIGSHVTAELPRRGHTVRVIDNFCTRRRHEPRRRQPGELRAGDCDAGRGDGSQAETHSTTCGSWGCAGHLGTRELRSVPCRVVAHSVAEFRTSRRRRMVRLNQ